jgi:hypothetical protein
MRIMQLFSGNSGPIEVDTMKFECRKCKAVFEGALTFGDLEEIQAMKCGAYGTHALVGVGGE